MDVAWFLNMERRFPEWASVLASTQSLGRGQFGRTWYSPPGNVYGTVRVPWLGPVWSDLVPLMLADAMRRILNNLRIIPAIKWPNDLIVGGKKIGGILLESKTKTVMAGLGLNLVSAPQPHELRHPSVQPAGCLAELGIQLSPTEIWISFIREAQSVIQQAIFNGDPARFVHSLTPHLAYIGEPIRLDAHAAGEQAAVFLGLDVSGAIRVRTPDGEQIIRSGSIYPMLQM
jgi:BirA family biotin operon repressor/biotin-[acetyl-CoA-carboxylase] ligase